MSRWVYISVVVMLSCPSMTCTARRSAPPSTRWVAKECRKVCGLIVWLHPAFRARSWIIRKTITRVSCFPLLLRNKYGVGALLACSDVRTWSM